MQPDSDWLNTTYLMFYAINGCYTKCKCIASFYKFNISAMILLLKQLIILGIWSVLLLHRWSYKEALSYSTRYYFVNIYNSWSCIKVWSMWCRHGRNQLSVPGGRTSKCPPFVTTQKVTQNILQLLSKSEEGSKRTDCNVLPIAS